MTRTLKTIRTILLSVFLTALSISFINSSAMAKDWLVAKVSANVKVSQNANPWTDLTVGSSISSYSWINTGKRGRALLQRGSESLWIKPNSLVGIFEDLPGRTATMVRAQFGSLRADVQTKDKPHFTVETPLLAAVVKGTMFDVVASRKKSSVSVQRGIVNVTDQKRGLSVDIVQGQSAQSGAATSQTFTVSGPGANSLVINTTAPIDTSLFADQSNANAVSRSTNSNANARGNSSNANTRNAGNGNSSSNNGNSGNSRNSNSGNSNSNSNSNSGSNSSSNGNSATGNSGNSGNSAAGSNAGNGNSGNGKRNAASR